MTDSKDYRSIDELFKRTFDELPDAPSGGGWDVPSAKVWEHVQERIQTPQSGWSAQTLALVSAFAVVLMIGLYFFVASGSDKQDMKAPVSNEAANVSTTVSTTNTTTAPTTPTVVTETPAITHKESTAVENTPHHVASTPKAPKQTPRFNNKTKANKSAALPEKSERNEPVNHVDTPARPSGALPLPGTKPVPPNSTVAKHQ